MYWVAGIHPFILIDQSKKTFWKSETNKHLPLLLGSCKLQVKCHTYPTVHARWWCSLFPPLSGLSSLLKPLIKAVVIYSSVYPWPYLFSLVEAYIFKLIGLNIVQMWGLLNVQSIVMQGTIYFQTPLCSLWKDKYNLLYTMLYHMMVKNIT